MIPPSLLADAAWAMDELAPSRMSSKVRSVVAARPCDALLKGGRIAGAARSIQQRKEQAQRLSEAKFVYEVIRVVRTTINSERWQRDHQCPNVQGVWRLWMQAAAQADAAAPSTLPAVAPSTLPAVAPSTLPAVAPSTLPPPQARAYGSGANAARAKASARAAAGVRSSRAPMGVRSGRVSPPMGIRSGRDASPTAGRQLPQKKLDAAGLRAALSFTFPEGSSLGEDELAIVYRSLDATGRGHVTLSTFSSVFSARRRDQEGRQHYYQSLPTWGETVGGYIPKDEKTAKGGADVGLQHGRAGIEMPDEARGVAAGFGLGHVEPGVESLGWEMRAHGDLDANVLKWGEGFESPPKPPPPPPRNRKPKPKPKPPPPPPPKVPKREVPKREVERRYRNMKARVVQREYRSHLEIIRLRDAERRRLEELRKAAATTVQARVRAHQARGAYLGTLHSSLLVQKATRTLLSRLQAAAAHRELQRLRQLSAIKIQQAVRKWHFRRVVAAWRIERSFRAHLCHRLLKSLRSVRLAEEERERAAAEMAMMNAQMARAAAEAEQAAQEASRLKGLTAI